MTARRAFALLLLLPFAAVHGEAGRTAFGTVVDEAGRPVPGPDPTGP
ncbi:MAG TPA: hypothetical protein VLT87_20565 [Thermoanaerobaculia bacterium]|nr:hypothetical protein [Thermoanaerobaculia bacterium]